MSNKKLKRRSFVFGLLFILILFFPVSVTKVSSLDNAFYFTDKEFSIYWIHSVEKEAWQEFYERQGKDLVLTYTKFKTFGAGVPSQGKIKKNEKGFITYEIGRRMEGINLIVSENVKSTLFIKNRKIPLYKFAGNYEEITIKQVKRPLCMAWMNQKI
ncbi:DUF1850 domain-containing protein [Calidifontibacillus oryziterrae]|uniref:DUF1850 domain-containing protein n=1 Tax=Calidifontibacillus oryziterrae TaxID=1191699 RepID=UPI0002EC0595|nr:DUF1850 domain-containing protein [Calidifontibacillus oryziterrae]